MVGRTSARRSPLAPVDVVGLPPTTTRVAVAVRRAAPAARRTSMLSRGNMRGPGQSLPLVTLDRTGRAASGTSPVRPVDREPGQQTPWVQVELGREHWPLGGHEVCLRVRVPTRSYPSRAAIIATHSSRRRVIGGKFDPGQGQTQRRSATRCRNALLSVVGAPPLGNSAGLAPWQSPGVTARHRAPDQRLGHATCCVAVRVRLSVRAYTVARDTSKAAARTFAGTPSARARAIACTSRSVNLALGLASPRARKGVRRPRVSRSTALSSRSPARQW